MFSLLFPQSENMQGSKHERAMLITHRALELAETTDRLVVGIQFHI